MSKSLVLCSLLFVSGSVQAEAPSLEAKIGQMLMVGFRGLQLQEGATILGDIRTRNLGGVVLYSLDVPTQSPRRNIESPEQVERLVGQLRAAAAGPLLVAIDQEGGKVRRLREPFGLGDATTARELSSQGNTKATAAHARQTAKTLAALGINLNLAPVVDLDVNPENPVIGAHGRSYGKDPDTVVRHATAVIDAHHQFGVLVAIKHFPGHGSSRHDSHHGLPDITRTWSRRELAPFERLARHTDAVMTAHIYHRGLDPAHPATLSQAILDGLLRQQLGFDGVVITDDMQMTAISGHYGLERAIELAIGAGVDIMMFSNNSVYEEAITARAIFIVKKLVAEGKLHAAQIDRAYRRIQRLKVRLH